MYTSVWRPSSCPPPPPPPPSPLPLTNVSGARHATGPRLLLVVRAHVGQATLGSGWVDSVGLGRMVLSYPDLPADVLAGRPLRPRSICRTFSDCTTAPRHGLVSGCYPLDEFYRDRPERLELAGIKRRLG